MSTCVIGYSDAYIVLCYEGSVSTVFNQATLHSTSLDNVNGTCEKAAMARYDKKGIILSFIELIVILVHRLFRHVSFWAGALYRLTYSSAPEYLEDKQCMDVLDLRNFG